MTATTSKVNSKHIVTLQPQGATDKQWRKNVRQYTTGNRLSAYQKTLNMQAVLDIVSNRSNVHKKILDKSLYASMDSESVCKIWGQSVVTTQYMENKLANYHLASNNIVINPCLAVDNQGMSLIIPLLLHQVVIQTVYSDPANFNYKHGGNMSTYFYGKGGIISYPAHNTVDQSEQCCAAILAGYIVGEMAVDLSFTVPTEYLRSIEWYKNKLKSLESYQDTAMLKKVTAIETLGQSFVDRIYDNVGLSVQKFPRFNPASSMSTLPKLNTQQQRK